MIMAGVLERATTADSPLFIVKGGVALELRLRDRARATKDIDIVLRNPTADLADSLEQALTGEPYQWASAIRDLGLLPLYSTSWGNSAFLAVARKLSLKCASDWSAV